MNRRATVAGREGEDKGEIGGGGGGHTSSISISHCVLTRVINCREEGKDGWRRRDGDGERRRSGREGEEKSYKGKKKKKNTLERAMREREQLKLRRDRRRDTMNRNAAWKK